MSGKLVGTSFDLVTLMDGPVDDLEAASHDTHDGVSSCRGCGLVCLRLEHMLNVSLYLLTSDDTMFRKAVPSIWVSWFSYTLTLKVAPEC